MSQLTKERIPGSDGIHQLSVTIWEEPAEIKGVVQIVHGMREYVERYNEFAVYLVNHGFVVAGHDHLGHGDTAVPGEEGFFGEKDGAKALVLDCVRVTRWLRDRYPGLPLFLLGHSMGSFVGRLAILQTASTLSGFLCLGTGGGKAFTPYARVLTGLLSKAKGPGGQSGIAHKVMNAYSAKNLNSEEAEDAWISRDPAVVSRYSGDERTRFEFTNQAYSDLLDLQIAANRKEWYRMVDKHLPILLLSGTNDPIGDMGKDLPKIWRKLAEAGVQDIEYKQYPGARHELLNELNRREVFSDILGWLEEHLPEGWTSSAGWIR
ncbi:MAG: alpha/beta fold hydrolase [Oscillospiraceae bacterium]